MFYRYQSSILHAFYGYPFGYPWISMDIHALTCYEFSIQGWHGRLSNLLYKTDSVVQSQIIKHQKVRLTVCVAVLGLATTDLSRQETENSMS